MPPSEAPPLEGVALRAPPPPGLPITEAVLLSENAALAEENRRLAEENARLLHAQLAKENAELVRQNAALLQLHLADAGVQPGLLGSQSPPGTGTPQVGAYSGPGSRVPSPPPGTWMPSGPGPSMPPGAWGAQAPGAWARPTWPPSPSGTGSSSFLSSGSGPPSGRSSEIGTPPVHGKRMSGTSCEGSTTGTRTFVGSSSGSERSGATSTTPSKEEVGGPPKTTVMMRSIPNDYTRDLLLALFDGRGFKGCYNLVYLPIDFSSQAGFGYAFVDLKSTEEAERFKECFQGFQEWAVTSDKVCEVLWSAARQGLQANIERFRNSPVMHESVPDKFRPALFVDGARVPFPPPTRRPRAPEIAGLPTPA